MVTNGNQAWYSIHFAVYTNTNHLKWICYISIIPQYLCHLKRILIKEKRGFISYYTGKGKDWIRCWGVCVYSLLSLSSMGLTVDSIFSLFVWSVFQCLYLMLDCYLHKGKHDVFAIYSLKQHKVLSQYLLNDEN